MLAGSIVEKRCIYLFYSRKHLPILTVASLCLSPRQWKVTITKQTILIGFQVKGLTMKWFVLYFDTLKSVCLAFHFGMSVAVEDMRILVHGLARSTTHCKAPGFFFL